MDEDMVVLSQNEYDELLKAKHNLEYLQMLAISDQQIREGKVVNNTKYVVGVDSGTLAVFDYDFYRKNYQCVRDADYNNWEGIYRKMCDKLEELPNYAGLVAYENRCVDITGFGGDGGYDAEFGFDKDGWCVEIVIHFYGDTEWYDQYDAEEEIEESF